MTNLNLLSPIIGFLLLGIVAFYLVKRYKGIKILPRDYIIFYNFEIKFRKNIERYTSIITIEKAKRAFIFLAVKFLQRLKTDTVRLQLFFENLLNKLKNHT
jgi:hypothetical protein